MLSIYKREDTFIDPLVIDPFWSVTLNFYFPSILKVEKKIVILHENSTFFSRLLPSTLTIVTTVNRESVYFLSYTSFIQKGLLRIYGNTDTQWKNT